MTSATCGTRSDVKASLTPRRRGRVVENRPVRRLCPARHRRLQPPRAAGDIDAISDMTGIAAELDDAITEAVTSLASRAG
jgi:hypothetical protein